MGERELVEICGDLPGAKWWQRYTAVHEVEKDGEKEQTNVFAKSQNWISRTRGIRENIRANCSSDKLARGETFWKSRRAEGRTNARYDFFYVTYGLSIKLIIRQFSF